MDRSAEFRSLLTLLNPVKDPVASASSLDLDAAQPTDFSVSVLAISERFSSTERHVTSIRKLVDQRSLFYNEPGAEIDEVSALFADENKELDQQLALLLSWLDRNITGGQRRRHCDCVIGVLKTRRAEFVQSFQDALKQRTEVLKSKVRRQTQFGSSGIARQRRELDLGTPLFNFSSKEQALPAQAPSQAEGAPGALPLLFAAPPPTGASPAVAPPAVAPPAAGPGWARPAVRQAAPQFGVPAAEGVRRRGRTGPVMSQVFMEEEEQDKGVEAAARRLGTARGIESEIAKLGEVFQRFSALVVEQGESLRVIDADVESAALEVEEGHRHIVKTHSITQGNRGVIIKIFATILVLAVVLVTT
jgi:hypothetical protein